MTNNQIQYLKYLEDKRSNVTRETETNRDNTARLQETNRYNTIYTGETGRSNLARETETNRSNLSNEANARTGLAINDRHYRAQDQIGYMNVAENQRHNAQTEKLGILQYNTEDIYKEKMGDSALKNADSNKMQAIASWQNAGTNSMNADTNRANQEELTKLQEAQRFKTYVNIGTDINDSLSQSWRNASQSAVNVASLAPGGKGAAAKALTGMSKKQILNFIK